MVVIILLLFWMVNGTILNVYEIVDRENNVKSAKLDENARDVEKLLEAYLADSDGTNWAKLVQELQEKNYRLCVMDRQEILFSNIGETKDVKEYLVNYHPGEDSVCVYVTKGLTILSLRDLRTGYDIYATAGTYSEFWNGASSKVSLFMIVLVDGLICIGVLVLVSLYFTSRLSKRIMEPLERLSEGVRRVEEGNLTVPVEYSGENEFVQVCQTFNRMQTTILEERKQKQQYEDARKELVAGISHDLRTPLTAIRGSIKGILDGVTSTPGMQQKFLETAYRRTLDMDTLLERLFYFSKLETGKLPMHMEFLPLGDFLEEYVDLAKGSAREKAVHIALEREGESAWILADPDQLKRILDNLVENSIKYGDSEFVEINIRLTGSADLVVLQYTDNGPGVPEDKMPHIFEEFYRCDDSRNQKEGSGLGLYIVKYLVEKMNGTVSARNTPGLSISMEFPRKEPNDVAEG